MTQSAIKLESPDAVNLPLAETTKSHIEINICNKSSASESLTTLLSLGSGMQETIFQLLQEGKLPRT